MIKILQINTNKARGAFDMMLHTAREMKADIILNTEPNENKLDESWLVEPGNSAAIKCMGAGLPPEKKTNQGFAWIHYRNIYIYSCYISPNADIETYQTFLENLENSYRQHHHKKKGYYSVRRPPAT